mmetsp:Transcript_665/g.1317  ORF Transcript_665/g.1317 Transcript_665/m.1317 type:complete len:236 (+) Transcript_665:1488-2195(+)
MPLDLRDVDGIQVGLEHRLDHAGSGLGADASCLEDAGHHNPVPREDKVNEVVEHSHGDGAGCLPLRDSLRSLLQLDDLLVLELRKVMLQHVGERLLAVGAAVGLRDAAFVGLHVHRRETIHAAEVCHLHLRDDLAHPGHHPFDRHEGVNIRGTQATHCLGLLQVVEPRHEAGVKLLLGGEVVPEVLVQRDVDHQDCLRWVLDKGVVHVRVEALDVLGIDVDVHVGGGALPALLLR